MDVRYSRTAKTVMFSARLEAINAGSQHVEPEHLLLGLLHRSSQAIEVHMAEPASLETLERELKSTVAVEPSLATYVQVPFSPASDRILSVAAEEAKRHSHETVGTEHILLAILREEQCPASRVLRAKGMQPFVPNEDQQALKAP
jgi:ATP-dependent Clp protease ATP-binding subunit ClpC